MPTTDQLVKVLEAPEHFGGLKNARGIIVAFDRVGADTKVDFDLAAVAASVQDESGGWNTWGHDPWEGPHSPYPKGIAHEPSRDLVDPVTEDNFKAYWKLMTEGGWQPQGVGPSQITEYGLQAAAEAIGGAWHPENSMTVGFHDLKQLFVAAGSAQLGYQHYNGSGPAAVAYGIRLNNDRLQWQAWINGA